MARISLPRPKVAPALARMTRKNCTETSLQVIREKARMSRVTSRAAGR